VDDIYTVLGALGITKNIVLVGHSLGANYAIRYASEHSDQVVKLVLTGAYPFIVPDCAVSSSCATSCFNPATCESNFCYAFGLTDTVVAGLTAPLTTCLGNGGTEEACLNLWAQFLAPIWYNEPCQSQLQEAQAGLVDAVTSSTVPIINSLFNFAVTEDIRSIAAGLTLPTLITFGSNDIVINPGNAALLHEQIANSVLAEFVGKGHQMHVTDYKSFDRLVAEFIGACSLPDTIKVFDQGCCVCPLTKPVDYQHDACCK
jgi:pimeloyl-ACP methyl ester carboxylesterase